MAYGDYVALVRCRVEPADTDPAQGLRYVPLSEFGLWQHLMELGHGRRVVVESVSVWIPEALAAQWGGALEDDDLTPVFRVCFEQPGPLGVAVASERFFAAETFQEAREAMLGHLSGVTGLNAEPGYFVRSQAACPSARVA